MNSIVYKSHVTGCILGIRREMVETCSSIMESVYNMPELKACPIEATFKIIGKKWSVLLMREMLRGTTQFNRFLENIDGITPKVLTERLRELEKLGIVKRRIASEYPIRVEYGLTDLGREFEPVLLAAALYSMKHMAKNVFKDGKPRTQEDILQLRR